MAGGKETPRQKMIGMMYLVLTALLALQVSNAVLEKFAIINETLSELIETGKTKSEESLKALIDAAGKSEKPEILKAKENALKVRELTKSTLASIEDLKKKMMAQANSDKVTEALINDHSMKVAAMMIDPKSPEGKSYEKLLNDYVKQLTELSGHKFEKLAKAPKEIPLFAENESHKEKDFLTFTFENTPVIAALASVTQVETEILDFENQALGVLRAKADAEVIRMDQFIPMVKTNTSRVAAGAKYEGELFLTASSSAIIPEYYKDGAKLQIVDGTGGVKMGKIEFTASGGNYDPQGLAKKSFKATIKLGDRTFEENITYEVVQPVIRVTTGNAPTLYMNCGNTVNIEVPALGSNYNPSFSSPGADIRKSDKPGKVTIIPSQRKINVSVSNGGAPIGVQPFDVKNIPEPRFVAYVGNSPVDVRQGIKASQLRSLRIVVEPDANFKEEVPKDARYNIKSMEVILGSGPTAKSRMSANNGSPDLGAWGASAKPGDRIVFDIKDAVRKTFTDSEEKVPVKGSNGVVIIPISN
jgi:gliding motility-associated protein GldM